MNKRLNIKQILSTLWPAPCMFCGTLAEVQDSICHACQQDLPWHTETCCNICALPLSNAQGDICGQCLKQPPTFKHTKALFRYAFPIDRILQSYKYEERLTIAHFFANSALQCQPPAITTDLLIPMPLHPSRLTTRGFNQSLEIARQLSKAWAIPLDKHSCKRIKNTPPQASLKFKDRLKNVNNAFDCMADFSGQHILIIDDVMTTGASLNALSKVICKAGAASVSCLVMARTVPHR